MILGTSGKILVGHFSSLVVDFGVCNMKRIAGCRHPRWKHILKQFREGDLSILRVRPLFHIVVLGSLCIVRNVWTVAKVLVKHFREHSG